MGRQKTLWIDEDCWKKLEMMEGDSISQKVRECINQYDLATGAQIEALRRQIAVLNLECQKLNAKRTRRTME